MEPDLVQELSVLLRRADAATVCSARLVVRSREAVTAARATSDALSERRRARWRRRYELAYSAHLKRLADLDLLAS